MNRITYFLGCKSSFKRMIKNEFSFLEDEYNFNKTGNKDLTVPEWIERGIVYTNNNIVIAVCDDLHEKRITTIIYKIQNDRKIPIDSIYYFTLESFLASKEDLYGVREFGSYENYSDFLKCINSTKMYLKKHIPYLLTL